MYTMVGIQPSLPPYVHHGGYTASLLHYPVPWWVYRLPTTLPGTMVGIPASLLYPSRTMVGIPASLLYPTLHHPGYTGLPPAPPCCHHPCWPAARCADREPWAHLRRNPWVWDTERSPFSQRCEVW